MKEMLMPNEFQAKVDLGFSPDFLRGKWKGVCFSGAEPTSVLDTSTRSPSPPTSSSTSFGGGGDAAAGMTTTVASMSSAQQEADLHPILTSIDVSGHGSFDPSFDFGIYTCDADDSSFGLNKFLLYGASSQLEPSFDFAVLDPAFQIANNNLLSHNGGIEKPPISANPSISSPLLSTIPSQGLQIDEHQYHNQVQSAGIEPLLLSQPPPKRHNRGELFFQRQQQFQGFPPASVDLQQRPVKTLNEDHNLHQAVIEQLYKVAEMLETGNLVLAQGILARLNQQLSPVGRPFHRAAFYFKEALQQLLHFHNNVFSPHPSTPFDLIFRIGAYKSFSEVSPVLQFANFTSTQAFLEALDGSERIHIFDFDIGYGCQWASLMQELAGRSAGSSSSPSLKLTAFISTTAIDEFELRLTRENLFQFAREINVAFDFDIITMDSMISASWSVPYLASENEGVAVNIPLGFSSFPLPFVLRFVKQFSPKIVVSMLRGSDLPDVSFPQHVIHSLQSHCTLLESLDAVNANSDSLQKMEKFLLYPDIEKLVLGFYQLHERSPPWRTVFLSTGFSPLPFSNFNESQAECLAKRSPVRGFHVEKRHSSLVLCWQRKELVSVSAWTC